MAHVMRMNGQSGARSSNCECGVRARERERESGRARMAAEGEASATGASRGRPWRIHLGICEPRGCRALAARHGGTAWPVVVRGHGRGCGEGETRWWAGPASDSGPEAWPRPASAPLFPFLFILKFFLPNFFQADFDSLKIFFRFGS